MCLLQAKSEKQGMVLAYRTVQYPQMADCATSGKALDSERLGERYHVAYLNAAGREVLAAPTDPNPVFPLPLRILRPALPGRHCGRSTRSCGDWVQAQA